MHNKLTLREMVMAVSPCGPVESSPRIAAAAWRGGGVGVLDLADGGWPRLRALAQVASWSTSPLAVRVPADCDAGPAEVRRCGAGRVGLVVLPADSPWDIAETASWSRVLVEVTSHQEARAAAASGAHGLITRGMEAGGRVGSLSTFVLLQQLIADETLTLPVWAMGGIGPRTAVACVIGGAVGVVLDSQLGLMPESDLRGDIRRVLRRMDGSETVMAAGQHGIQVTGTPARLARPGDTETTLLPVGQDGQLAALFSDRWPDTAAAVRGLRLAILDAVADSGAVHPLAPGAPLAADLGVRVPVAQGPMTRVSDQPGFAAAVAADGAMPFIALALADGERSRNMLEAAAAALDGQPWGVGVLGFVPDELRVAQLAAVLQAKPSWVILAGGRPAQAKELEQAGIATFLHVPSPVLLGQFLRSGSRRFVFEGAECGGHIGPRASFPLWEAQLAVIDDYLDKAPADAGTELQVLFAGGIHDARSAAMVAAMARPLARRGVGVGVLMGTSYLLTREAVEHGAIRPLFQQMTVEAAETALLETSPGHVTRALRTPFVEEFARRRSELKAAGLESGEARAQLELLNIGRLRLASKGVEHDGTEIDERTQEAEGLYMAGQVAVLRDRVTTVPALHADVTSGAMEFHRTRVAELQRMSAAGTNEADKTDESARPLDIAVVGMSGVFPGSPDLDGFWRLVLSGGDAFTEVPPERWDTSIFYTSELMESNSGRRTVSKWGGFLQPVVIDPIRYGIPPSALGSIDPSQLLALEIADRALNDAGYPSDAPGADHSRTGVIFAAEPGSDDGGGLGLRALLPAYLGELPPEFDEQLPTYTEDTFPGHLANVVAGRIANRLNLGGANFTVDAACAASLAAVDMACKQLATGTADLMLCGAVDLHNSIGDFLMFGSVYALSPRGRVAAFDSEADGTTLGEGVACVVLKRLADAQRDGDRIYAVINGVGAASDGRSRSLTAPHPGGQMRAMRQAYRQAGISPSEVGLVEAHGTGTVLGDQTELDSLTQVFAEADARPGACVLGSVKSQIGHTKAAAGLAGLIRAVLAVSVGVQPPTSNLVSPNPCWHPESSPFAFLTEARPWVVPSAQRRAGVSAFGFGGTNFHVVLSGYAGTPEPRHALNEWPAELFCFRGTSQAAVHQAVRDLADALEARRPAGTALRDLAARAAADAEAVAGTVRVAVVARDTEELAALLQRALAGEHDPAAGLIQSPEPQDMAGQPIVAFLFPGQGSQRTGALAELFVAFPELRQYLELGDRWVGRLFPPAAFGADLAREYASRLRDTRVAQPTLGMCGLAVSHLLGRLGIRPDMSGGHSYGELVALCTAGAFDPATLIDLSTERAAAILVAAGEDPGAMAAVSGTADQIQAVLAGSGLAGAVVLANHNGPRQVVVSGLTPAVDEALTALQDAGLSARRLPVACAFHSPVIAAASAQFAEALAARQVSPPQRTVWSNRTAAPYPDDPELVRAELAAQISAPVRFVDQVEAMYAAGARVFVEAGPGQVLTGLVGTVLGDRPHVAVACDGPRGQGLRQLLLALAQLACAGVPLQPGWLFQGRKMADSLPPVGRPFWTVNGQLVRDADGGYVPGALIPVQPIKELTLPSSTSGGPADRDTALVEYLRASRDLIAAQRDVMLSALGGQPAGQLVWQPGGSAAPPAIHGTPRLAASAGAALVTRTAPESPTAAVVAASSGALPSRAELQDAVLTLIGERTGYPVDLIAVDLDLEAELSIDSIKRAEIAAELASTLGVSGDVGESAFESLVKARTVQAITDWLTEAGEAAPSGAAAVAPESAASAGAVASDDAGNRAESVGTAPLRLLPQMVTVDAAGEPSGSLDGTCLTITGETAVADRLAGLLRDLGARVQLSALDAITVEDIHAADGLILLDGLTAVEASLPLVAFPLIKDALNSSAVIATGRGYLLAAGERGSAAAAGLAGLFRAAAAEYPESSLRYVEFDRTAPVDDVADRLLAELRAASRGPMVTYTGDKRQQIHMVPAELSAAAEASCAAATQAAGLTPDCVVVLIGGARGIAAGFARELAAASGCRIELIGRTELSGERLPDDVAAAADAVALRAALARQGMRAPAEIERATRTILARREIAATLTELRALGSQVRYHSANAQDDEAIRGVLKTVYGDYGRIDGLVYAAGIIEDRLIAGKDPESFARVFNTKAIGAQVMFGALDQLPSLPRFVVLFGSIAAVFGSRGQVDYAAANDALEVLGTAWASRTAHRCLTVHWGPWAPVGAHPGMVTPELAREYDCRGMAMISPQAGALSLLRELAWGDAGITAVVYTGAATCVG
jgi:acyl transferase domain-containing protein/NAD(P)H-dependent flavin oxidoreductase YrpB (nitropropane dioxygenase family)